MGDWLRLTSRDVAHISMKAITITAGDILVTRTALEMITTCPRARIYTKKSNKNIKDMNMLYDKDCPSNCKCLTCKSSIMNEVLQRHDAK